MSSVQIHFNPGWGYCLFSQQSGAFPDLQTIIWVLYGYAVEYCNSCSCLSYSFLDHTAFVKKNWLATPMHPVTHLNSLWGRSRKAPAVSAALLLYWGLAEKLPHSLLPKHTVGFSIGHMLERTLRRRELSEYNICSSFTIVIRFQSLKYQPTDAETWTPLITVGAVAQMDLSQKELDRGFGDTGIQQVWLFLFFTIKKSFGQLEFASSSSP